jgi:hypothetical protein
MATISTFLTGEQSVEHEILGGYVGFIKNTLSFATTNVSAADVVQALKVGIGMLITGVWVKITTAEGGTSTNDIGDGDDPNGFDDAVNFNAAANTVTSDIKGTDAYAGGKYYAAADTIDIVPDNDLDTAVIEIVAAYVRLTT